MLLAMVGFVPASDVAVAVVNRVITQQIGATLLPGLELRDGVPPDLAHHCGRADPADDDTGNCRSD